MSLLPLVPVIVKTPSLSFAGAALAVPAPTAAMVNAVVMINIAVANRTALERFS
jgi:hypothetical protein